jgi:hypothetical protein
MTGIDTCTTATDQARSAVERSAELWQQGTRSLTEQAGRLWRLPQPDAVGDATRKFFRYLQDGLEVNKNVTLKWLGALISVTEAFGDQWEAVTDFHRGHGQAIGTWISGESETFGGAARQQAERVEKAQREQVGRVEQAQRDRDAQARQAERDQARAEREQAREWYQGLTKAELSDKLAERDLPKTGTVEQLVERLVSADTN